MLKRLVGLILVLILSLFVTNNLVYSQEPPQENTNPSFDRIYEDYIGTVEEYNKAHSEYILKRAQFLKFQSLKSRQDAYDATLVMLEKRDDVVVSYLKVLRKKVEEGIGIPDARKEGLFFRIDEETAWYENHGDNLSTTGSLDDLVDDSDLAAERWSSMDLLAYETMSVLSQGKIASFSERVNTAFSETKDKLDEIRNDEREGYSFSTSKFETLDRWIFEADGKLVRSQGKQDEADLLISEIASTKKDVFGSYEVIISKLKEAQLYMKDTSLFLKEIIKQIKTDE